MSFIIYKNKKIFYERHGNGEKIFFIHEWNSSSQLFKRYFFPCLKKFEIIYLDLPGFGKSQFVDLLSFRDLRNIIKEIIKVEKLGRVNLIGFCYGAIIALDFAIQNPNLVKKVFLLEIFIKFPIYLKILTNEFISKNIFILFYKYGFIRKLFQKVMMKNRKFNFGFFWTILKKSKNKVSNYYMKMGANYSRIDHIKRIKKCKFKIYSIYGNNSLNIIKKTNIIFKNVAKNIEVFSLRGLKHFAIFESPEKISKVIKKLI